MRASFYLKEIKDEGPKEHVKFDDLPGREVVHRLATENDRLKYKAEYAEFKNPPRPAVEELAVTKKTPVIIPPAARPDDDEVTPVAVPKSKKKLFGKD